MKINITRSTDCVKYKPVFTVVVLEKYSHLAIADYVKLCNTYSVYILWIRVAAFLPVSQRKSCILSYRIAKDFGIAILRVAVYYRCESADAAPLYRRECGAGSRPIC